MKEYTLGLDMGVASIGWACVSENEQQIDSGVRVFPAGVDAFNSPKEKHPNLDRRSARGMRRRIRRKAERKALIKTILQRLGWMPSDESEIQAWLGLDVYELRSKAISDKVSLSELGRIILHLNQRRGFLSLRKKDETNADKDTSGILGEMTALQKEIDEGDFKTLGNYLHHLYQNDQYVTPNGKIAKISRLRNRHIRRSMLHHEFSLIWETQALHHPELTDELRYGSHGKQDNPIAVVKPTQRIKGASLLEQFGVENFTFFQRKVYWPTSSIGKCEWETNERRAPIADRRFQEFRLLQEVNNLSILDSSEPRHPIERALSKEERDAVIGYLSGKKEAKFDALKKHLIKQKHLSLPDSIDQFSFNLEQGGRTKISATPTDSLLAGKNLLSTAWARLPEKDQNTIITLLTSPDATDDDLAEELAKIESLSPAQVTKLLTVSLPTGYCHLSVKFLENVLPFMRKGMTYMARDSSNSAIHAAGYQRRDEKIFNSYDSLPPFEQVTRSESVFYQPHQTVINNPVVLRSLTELRKVVNALIKKHGKPSRIHLEMARDLKMSPKQRTEHQKKNNKLQKDRDAAAKEIEKLGIVPNRDAVDTYRLWKDQSEQCIYSGKPIAAHQLFTGETDVDHIFPFSKSADNSYFNKVVCLAEENRLKGQRLPYTWLAHSDPEKYEEVLQRARKLERGKFKKFIAEQIPEGFVARNLNDTAWMTKAARQYLSLVVENPAKNITCLKGAHTATMRSQWELHSLLRSDGIDLKLRDDHRHHALDAIVIALCNQARIQEITRKLKHETRIKEAKEAGKRIYRLKPTEPNHEKLALPWKDFRLDVAASLNKIWVSHRAKRKISGPLHKETNYGKTPEGLLTVRKAVQALSQKDIEHIRDSATQRFIKDYISEHGGDITVLKNVPENAPLHLPSGIPIKKVTVAIPYAHLTIRKGTPQETHVQSASTHHLAIFSLGDGKYHFEPVTLFEASYRLKNNQDVIQKHFLNMPPEAEFLFHLCSGDSMMARIDGKDQLFVFKTMNGNTKQTFFAYHTDASQGNRSPDNKDLRRSSREGTFARNFPNARKVTILPDGSLRNA